MITENLSTLKIHKLTKEQYDRELASGNIDETALYLTPEEEIDLSGYATIEEMNDKADKDHNHDDRYYTETEIDVKLDNVDVGIEITKAEYDALGDVVLTDGKTYFITDIDGGNGGSGGNNASNVVFDDTNTQMGVDNIQDAVEKCFQSVSNGKNLIASAITDKKVPTDATATFETMANNIQNLKLGSGNAVATDVLSGKTFTNNDGVEYTGTMPDLTNRTLSKCGYEAVSVVQHPDDPSQALVTIPYQEPYAAHSKGYIDETTIFTCNVSELKASNIRAGVRVGRSGNHGADDTNSILGTFTSDATATAATITKGFTAWVNGQLITGTRPAPSTMQSGSFGVSSASYETVTKTVYFSPEFDTKPEVTYTINAYKFSMQSVEVYNTHVIFKLLHSHGNDHHSGTVTWTATV